MKTYEIYSRGEEKCWLADTDTFTLALSDCADVDMAENLDETSAEMLADCFDFPALLALAIQIGSADNTAIADPCEKLASAIRIAAAMPDGILQLHTGR